MSWSTPADLRAQVQRLWDRGELLRACVVAEQSWPLRLALKVPGAADLADRFEAVRAWVGDLVTTPRVRVEWREWAHRVQGRQRIPEAVWLDSLADALALIGQTQAARCFEDLWQHTADQQPTLLPWLHKRPLQGLELRDRWDPLLATVAWIQVHPDPGVYLRQVDVPGVDSKFIEAHRGVLAEWLDLVLPPGAIQAEATGLAQFARRYGFLEEPLRLRFRLLDPTVPALPGCQRLADITLDAESFASLSLPVRRVFITENKTNFLAFPPAADAMVIFGAGYGWEALARASWLRNCDLRYWGDIDTHGFAILDQLRAHFPRAVSLLMDRETLLAHRAHWGQESNPVRHELGRLTAEEAEVYDDLRFDSIRTGLRLEQERVGFRWIEDCLDRLSRQSARR